MPEQVTVSAAANIALIKYWGKTGAPGNQPATGSLSIGIDDLRTMTRLRFADADTDIIESDLDEQAAARIRAFFDDIRNHLEINRNFAVTTGNNFPTGAGLASSASGFAALALAVNALCDLQLSGTELSRLARSGSGSAARSIFEGYVELIPADDAWAQQIMAADAWPLDVLVAVTDAAPKTIGSSEAMRRTAATSDYYGRWLDSHAADMVEAKQALADRDFNRLAEVSERNCLKMHATMMTSRPPIIYWQPATLAVMQRVRELRMAGTAAFFTVDAGAQVKVVCEPGATSAVADALDLPGISNLIRTRVGGAPRVDST